MATNFAEPRFSGRQPVIIGLGVMIATFVIGGLYLLTVTDIDTGIPYPEVLPWLLPLTVLFAVPCLILKYHGKFRLDNPIVFATLSYFGPAFIIGGFTVATGLSHPYFLDLIQDAKENFPFTMIIVMLGYGGLALGYFMPVGKAAGRITAGYLPTFHFDMESYRIPALGLLAIGVINSMLSLFLGLFGYQKASEIGIFDGLLFLTTLFWLEASFMLWLIVFKTRKFDNTSYVILVSLISTALLKSLFAGNKGSLIQIFIIISIAYVMSGRKFRAKHLTFAGISLIFALIFGTIYGTTFRSVKGTEDSISASVYADNVLTTIDKISTSDNSTALEGGLNSLAERIDAVSSLAVVVSTYEQLAPYEEGYGLDNNITKDLVTFFVPRVIWPDKPLASEPRRYSELYFNYGENSFIITPMGDLIRNFGLIGVPIGMFILGIILRFLYRTFIEDQPLQLWRATVFFMLLTAVSYESFYGSIVPYLFKVGTTAIIGVMFVIFLIRLISGRRRTAEPV